jgi:hypothetical protein
MLWTPGNFGTNWFNVIDDSSCMQGETKTVMGGLHDIHTELPDISTESDSVWVVETRQRNGKPPCGLSD